jgi:hypothetical protein
MIGSTDREEIRAALGPRARRGVRSGRYELDEIQPVSFVRLK